MALPEKIGLSHLVRADVAVPRPLRHPLLPAGPRLPCGERQAGGGAPAPGQDAVRRRGPHPPQAPSPPHPPALAAHPAHLPGRRPLWPEAGHDMVRGQRRRLHLRPVGQSRAAPPCIRGRRRPQGAPRRGQRGQDAGLRRVRLRRPLLEPPAPGRRPAGGDRAGLRRPLHRHRSAETPAISTKISTAPAARPRTSSSCTRASSRRTAPPARARSPTSSASSCTPRPTG